MRFARESSSGVPKTEVACDRIRHGQLEYAAAKRPPRYSWVTMQSGTQSWNWFLCPHAGKDRWVPKGVQAVPVPYFVTIAPTSDWKILKPSVPPNSASLARSGCGIMPSTLRPALQMPAMLSSDPLGLASGVMSPAVVE